MTAFLIKSAIAMTALLAVYYLLLQREKMYRFNRFYLLGAPVFSIAVPFISLKIYREIPAPGPEPAILQEAPVHVGKSPQNLASYTLPQPFVAAPKPQINYWPYILWALYGITALCFALRFALNIRHLYRLARHNDKVAIAGGVLVLLDDCPMPYTFMQYIFVCKKEYANKTIEHELLAHESIHVRQRHTLDILFIEALKTVLWFNPLLYAYKNAIQLNHEFLADDKTINEFNDIPTYQQMLLDKAIPYRAHLLASSINFSITKKRFIMMTKTTSTTKGIVLKTAMLPAVASLLYFLSTETVLYAKTPNSAVKTILSKSTAVDKFIPDAVEITDSTPETTPAQTPADTLVGDARRDEYFKGVRVVIEDEPRGVHIDMPYEKVPVEHKRFYINEVPQKKNATPVNSKDYDFALKQENTMYYIDEKKVPREEVLKHTPEDFVSFGFKMYSKSEPGGKMATQSQMFVFTRPFFEKNITHINDHYPDKVFTIRVTGVPVDTNKEYNERDASGKNTYQREQEALQAKLSADQYNYTGDIIAYNKEIPARFPGGKDAFDTYLKNNLRLPETYKDKEMWVHYTINTDGTVSDIMAREADEATQKEIERVFKASPRWIPEQKNGKPIQISRSMPLNKQ